ncbi:MAG: ribonuclease P protein component [Patescibacteria group bacterium]
MLQKEFRLRNDKDIKTLFDKGKSVFDVYCALRMKKNNISTSRFAVIVGTKVSKSAVIRNKLKRQVREAIHPHVQEIVGGYDIAMIIQKKAVGRKFSEIQDHVLSVLKKAKLLV